MELITQKREKQRAKELAVYADYQNLISQPGAMATAVNEVICKKYGFKTSQTVWSIRKRVEKRIKSGEIQ